MIKVSGTAEAGLDSHDNITLNSLRAQFFVPALWSGKLKAML
jgi:hypothetical protein